MSLYLALLLVAGLQQFQQLAGDARRHDILPGLWILQLYMNTQQNRPLLPNKG